jgi:hypothetical protein
MEVENLVKPFGDLDSPLMVLSSCPSRTTDYPAFATAYDMSNTCVYDMFTKLSR